MTSTTLETTDRLHSAEEVRKRADLAAGHILAARLAADSPYLDPAEGERTLDHLNALADAITAVSRDFQEHVAAPAAEHEIGRAIATVVGVFGTPPGANAKIYTSVMIQCVARRRPSIAALEQAVTQVLDSSRFSPSIAEVLETLSANEKPIAARLEVLNQFEAVRDRLERRIDLRRRQIESFKKGAIDA